jgi:beta-glucanase (GH16 family)
VRKTFLASTIMACIATVADPAIAAQCAPTISQNFSNGMGSFQTGSDWSQCPGSMSSQMSSYVVSQSCGPGTTSAVSVYQTGSGGLTLSVKPTPASMSGQVGGAPFIGGEITDKSQPQLYGYFQVTTTMPTQPGLNPAFWLLPASGAWPPELDVVEMPTGNGGGGNTAYGTLHSTDLANQEQVFATVNNPRAVHTYAVDWTASTITWYVDGVQTGQVATPADMHQPMYMLADLFSGTAGSWEGAPTPGETASMNIQSIQAFASNPYTSTTCTAPSSPTANPFAGAPQVDPAVYAADLAAVATAQTDLTAANRATAAVQQSVDAAIAAYPSPNPTAPGVALIAQAPSQLGCQPVTAPPLTRSPLTVARVEALALAGGIDPTLGTPGSAAAPGSCASQGQ